MADARGTPAGGEPRSALGLEELLDILRAAGLLTPEQAQGGRRARRDAAQPAC